MCCYSAEAGKSNFLPLFTTVSCFANHNARFVLDRERVQHQKHSPKYTRRAPCGRCFLPHFSVKQLPAVLLRRSSRAGSPAQIKPRKAPAARSKYKMPSVPHSGCWRARGGSSVLLVKGPLGCLGVRIILFCSLTSRGLTLAPSTYHCVSIHIPRLFLT